MYIDSHCHITCDDLYNRKEEVIQNMQELSGAMIMCTNQEEFLRALPIKEKDARFKIAWGWFPGDAKEISENHYQILQAAIDANQIDCLGEIGLDYHWDDTFKDTQKEVFIRQIEMANQANLPISIHMRDATKDCLSILKEHAKTKIIFHCFSGSLEILRQCLEMDSFISLAGPVTFKNARKAVNIAKECPLDRLLTETDSPYMCPEPFRGHQNEPMCVQYVAKKIAELKGMDLAEVCKQIETNYASIFA